MKKKFNINETFYRRKKRFINPKNIAHFKNHASFVQVLSVLKKVSSPYRWKIALRNHFKEKNL